MFRSRRDIPALLRRNDKWFVGGGRATLFAPSFPLHLEKPGFWDTVHFADLPVERLFTLFLAGEDDRPVSLEATRRIWRPDHLDLCHSAKGLHLREQRFILADDLATSRLVIRNPSSRRRRLTVLAFSLQERGVHGIDDGRAVANSATIDRGAAAWKLSVAPRRNVGQGSGRVTLNVKYACNLPLRSYLLDVAEFWVPERRHEASPLQPRWEITSFADKLHSGRLPNEIHNSDWEVDAGATPGHPSFYMLGLQYTLVIPPGAEREVIFGARLGLAPAARKVSIPRDPLRAARRNWSAYFSQVPFFACSDPYLTRAYWYRYYGLRLQMIDLRAGNFPHPVIFEGIEYFRAHIPYSVHCQMLETSWLHNPRWSEGNLLGLLHHQGKRGDIPGHIHLTSTEMERTWRTGYRFPYHITYLGNWGKAILQHHALHGRRRFLETIYGPLARYARHMGRDRDPERSGLIDVVNQCETGQEYMSRYLAIDPRADLWGAIRVKGLDATVYQYQLLRCLARIAAELGHSRDIRRHDAGADRVGQAVRDRMWDEKRGFFLDVDPRTMTRVAQPSAVGFYPFLTDIAGREHLRALRDHLLAPGRFWTPFPIPASSLEDPRFSATAEWKGKRHACPWNGRMWPMTSSHVADALGRVACQVDVSFKKAAVHLIERFVRTLFFDGDPTRPNCFEHYNPLNGAPSAYRGIDDYQHSYVADLIVRYVAGLQVEDAGQITVHPLPFDLDWYRLEDLRVRGHRVDVLWNRHDGLTVRINRRTRCHRARRGPVTLELDG